MRPVFHFDNITDGGFLNDGSLVTVNGVATYFGTTLINDKTVNNAVVQYNYGENTWKEIKSTETSRVSQTVVVIPESWLCKHTGRVVNNLYKRLKKYSFFSSVFCFFLKQ